jgi:tRNA-specific 2-thiouridylase
LDPEKNLEKKNININNLNLLVNDSELSKEILVKVRSTGKLLEAKVDLKNDNSAIVNLKDFEDGISPGQACVFYDRDKLGHKVLGGGWIK